ncbi:TPA: aminoimidazole riboside kinase [Raoultella ornithinolytica]|uniref:aminoimidazole riboside kinase n=1 Tax=Raoultella ornithinolytica TaxID=54291 RepID=UPI00273CFA96|nr:aminoimidazole riboside kinase [Raoultella ornithinolytica]WLP45216.1 aminoimidazole riboside kinase [Raoultella ornithinolytica]HEC2549605.1 aminoimidazole riboside kinase [Raoultella ornithinolytica]HEC2602535.1 aminoimidazole riboside kinase [Raoultella ornithinolytica]HEC2607579.1 aminoimidazole riboside kinase [Raoultella ornithinolytica]
MNAKVWVLGDAVVDLLPESGGRLLQCPGGAPANVAVGIARLGGNSGFIGRVGDDPFGRFMQQTLREEQVDTRYMRCDPQHRTSTVVVDLDGEGERTFTFMVRPSADLFLQPEDLPPFAANEWLHVCSIALSAEPSRSTTFAAMERIKLAGGRVSFDPNIRADLWQDPELLHACLDRVLRLANVVKLSEEELALISGRDDLVEGITALTQRYQPELLLVTQGKAGVLTAFQQQLTHFSAQPVVSVDTTGAGDAFVAGLLASLAAKGMPTDPAALEPAIMQAQTCGALATTAKGAMTALPYQHDLNLSF